jgi:hypothetical protein
MGITIVLPSRGRSVTEAIWRDQGVGGWQAPMGKVPKDLRGAADTTSLHVGDGSESRRDLHRREDPVHLALALRECRSLKHAAWAPALSSHRVVVEITGNCRSRRLAYRDQLVILNEGPELS